MSKMSFLKPFALTVGTLLASSQANAAAEAQMMDAVEHVARANATTNLGELTLAPSEVTMVADAHGSHSSHASHVSHASHSSHSSSAY